MRFLPMLLCLIATPVHAGEWSKADIQRQSVYVLLAVADWGQTRYIAESEYYETNPFLWENPSTTLVDGWFAAMLLIHFTVTDSLEGQDRALWQWAGILLEAGLVIHNYRVGIGWRF